MTPFPPSPSPVSDNHKNWQIWLRDYVVDPYTRGKVRHDPPSGFISAHAWLFAPKVFNLLFFCFFFCPCNSLQPRSLDGHWRKIRRNTQFPAGPSNDVSFRGREHKISYLDSHFSALAPLWGPFLTDKNVRIKIAYQWFTNAPVDRHRRRIKVA